MPALSRHPLRCLVLAAVLAFVVAGAVVGLRPSDSHAISAYFTETQGVYPGDKVTVLGVPVGTISTIKPERDRVRVDMKVDAGVRLPANVKAAITAPALVAVRTISLGPTYHGGRTLADHAVIPLDRTVAPVEWDEVKQQLTQLTTALGPDGANKNGTVSTLVHSGATYLNGQGESINQTIKNLAAALQTLSDNKGNLFATVRNLQVFVAALQGSDTQVRLFNQRLGTVSSSLAEDRGAVSQSLHSLRGALRGLRTFLRQNKGLTASTLADLRSTTSVLAGGRQRLADLLQVAPTEISNFYDILDPRNGAMTGVLAAQNANAPANILCEALLDLGGDPNTCSSALSPLVKYLNLNAPPTGLLPPLSLPTSKQGTGVQSATPGTGLLSSLATLLGGEQK